jgi:hypothetical protein
VFLKVVALSRRFFSRIVEEMKERLTWCKTTIEVEYASYG